MATQIVLTTTGTNNWTVPLDWNNASNTIEVIGAGGSGSAGGGVGASAGGGGGYGKILNQTLTPGSSISYTIATGGSVGDTYFNAVSLSVASVGSSGGGNGSSTGTPVGMAGVGKGTVHYNGGTGGLGSGLAAGGGGGGAAGPSGNGNNGSAGSGSTGGAGGSGDAGFGGAGGATGSESPGGNGTEWTSVGSGGGGAGGNSGSNSNGYGGNYGAGSGGGNAGHSAGVGSQGLIVITYNSVGARYWVGGTGTWDASSTTNWSATSGGSPGASAPSSITSAVYFDGNSGGGTVTMSANYTGITVSCIGFIGTLAQSTYSLTITGSFTGASGMTWSGSGANTIGGNFTLASGMTNSYTGAITFNSTTSQTITNGGVALASAITFNGIGGTWTLQDAMTNTGALTNTNGTVVFNNLNHSVASFTNAGTVTMGSGTLTLTGTGTVWSGSGTVISGSSTIKLTNASSSPKTFAGGGKTYNNLWLTGAGTGAFIISGSNTFQDFKCDTPPHTIQFTAGTTQTLNTFTVNGTSGNLMTLQSTTNGSPWYLVKSPSGTVSCDYLSLQDSHVS